MPEAQSIRLALKLLEEKLSWGAIGSWTNYNFKKLSEEIHSATKIALSPDTLKRFCGKGYYYKEEYNPQPQTKKAIAVFLGYTDWEDFKRKIKEKAIPPQAPAEPVLPEHPFQANGKGRVGFPLQKAKIIFISAAVLLLVAASLFYFSENDTEPRIEFTALYHEGPAPLLTTFKIKTEGVKDTLRLDFGDYSKKEPVTEGNISIPHHYSYPGFYRAILTGEGKVLATSNVHATTDGWQSEIRYHNIPYPIHLPRSGMLYISPDEVYAKRIIRNTQFYIKHINVRDYDAEGDNCMIECRIKNNAQDGGIDCFDFYLDVMGAGRGINILLLRPGCEIWSHSQFGEIKLDGRTTDLTALGQDFPDWRIFRMKVKDKKVSLYMDTTLFYTISYKEPVGRIKGLSMTFKGCGAVDFIKLYNGNNKLVYKDDFDTQ